MGRTYNEAIEELYKNGITPYDKESTFYNYNDYEDSSIKIFYERFFEFAQEYLDRDDLDFNIKPARIYFSTNTGLNALARKVDNYFLIEIYMGSIYRLHEFYKSKEAKFNINFLNHYNELTKIKNVSPTDFLFQLSIIYYLYHEVGHLIQCTSIDESYFEFLENKCKDDEVYIRHMRELDADWFSAHCMASHIVQFSELERENGKKEIDVELLIEIASLGLACIYVYYIDRINKLPQIYYEEECHPHPSVRLSYILIFFLDNLNINVSHSIDYNKILNKAIAISEILMKEDEKNIVEEYSKDLHKNIKEVELYINRIINNTNNYPHLCKHILKKE